MAIIFCVRIESNVSKDLHTNDGIDEEQHGNQQNDIRQGFEGLYKSPQQYSNGVTLSQKFDQSSSSKEPQKTDIDEILLKDESREIIEMKFSSPLCSLICTSNRNKINVPKCEVNYVFVTNNFGQKSVKTLL